MYYIKIEHFYYGENGHHITLLRDEQGELVSFSTAREAEEFIEAELAAESDSDSVFLLYNEYASPEYSVTSPGDWAPDCLKANGHELGYPYVPVAESDVPDAIRKTLLRSNVDWRKSCGEYDVYAAECDGYAIIYCPRSEALEVYADDLGNLNWCNYAFASVN